MPIILKNLPNCITVTRMLGTVALLFTKPLTTWFYIIYALTGLTDVLDGFLARRLKITNEFGAKLDSAADLLFYAVMLIMLMPFLIKKLPMAIWYCVAVVVLLRIGAYITAAIKLRKFAAKHSPINKITGAMVFSIPFILLLPFAVPVCFIICFVSGIGSLTEFIEYLKITQD
ncbi:MAG: CDP-alcohol phosphatidyltransferase family protein [Clostridia bacterium]|nr:CDP-alcohol phosphatidyltransferase family protein [Clostridia bacterium]